MFLKDMGVSEDDPPDEEDYLNNKEEWLSPLGLELLSTMRPLESLPSIALQEVLGYDLVDSDPTTGLALE